MFGWIVNKIRSIYISEEAEEKSDIVITQEPEFNLLLNGINYLIHPGYHNIDLDYTITVQGLRKGGICHYLGPFSNSGTLTVDTNLVNKMKYIDGTYHEKNVMVSCTFEDLDMKYQSILNCELSSVQGYHIVLYTMNKEKVVILNLNTGPLEPQTITLPP